MFACLPIRTETIRIGAPGTESDFFFKVCNLYVEIVGISGKSCVQAAKDALAESRRLVVDRCNCTRLQRRASRRFRCFRNLCVQTLHYFSDSGNSNDMKYVYNFVILYKWETNMKFHEIPTTEVDYMLPYVTKVFVPVLEFVRFAQVCSSFSCHLRHLIWGLAGACKRLWSWSSHQARQRPIHLSSGQQRAVACYLSDNCSDENLRFACGWIFQRRLEVLKQMEGVRLCWSIFLRMHCRRFVENVSCNVLDTPLCLRRIRV